jgi:methylenetetrahydrofolate reductase (NADPH)
MPVLNPKQIIRMSLLSACSIPAPLSKIICRYGEKPEEFKKAGLEYAVGQIICCWKTASIVPPVYHEQGG